MYLTYIPISDEWREARLNKLLQIMCILEPSLQQEIGQIQDFEGTLFVEWMDLNEVEEDWKKVVERLWNLFDENQIEHREYGVHY